MVIRLDKLTTEHSGGIAVAHSGNAPLLNFRGVLRFNAPVGRVERLDPVVKHLVKGNSDGHQSEVSDRQVE